MYNAVWLSRSALIFCVCFIIFANLVQSARLVDSDDLEPLIEPVADTVTNEDQEEEINKLLLMKKLLSVRNRALASTTFGTQRASLDTKNLKIEATDLHTAYRLPLHRLSDTQLQLLLQKYDDNNSEDVKQLSRPDMITRLQELITKDEKMLRPRLLTNINVMNPTDLALHEPVVDESEISRTTLMVALMESTQSSIETITPSTYEVTKIESIDSGDHEATRQSFLINNDNDDLETTELTTESTTQPEITTESTTQPEITTESTTESTSQSSEITTQAHKQIPMDIESKLHGNNDDEFDKQMREKNNRLHAQYIASLSEDLQRLKAKYDVMKLEFLRTLRRINERNVNRAKDPLSVDNVVQAAAPIFVVPNKDLSLEPIVEDTKGGIPLPRLEFINDTFVDPNQAIEATTKLNDVSTSSNQTTQTNQSEKPLGGERIEVELLANRESFQPTKQSEVDPSSVVNEVNEANVDKNSHPEIASFFKSNEQHEEQNKTTSIQSTSEVPKLTTIDDVLEDKEFEVITENPIHDNDKASEHDTTTQISESTTQINESTEKISIPIIGRVIHKLEKLVDQPAIHSQPSGIYHKISTVELEKLDYKTPKKLINPQTSTIVSNEEVTTSLPITQSDIKIPKLPEIEEKPLTIVEAMSKIEAKIMSPESWNEATKDNRTRLMEPKIQFKLKRIEDLMTAADLIDHLKLEARENKTIEEAVPCRRVSCDFEEGKLCQWKSSQDRLNLATRKYLVSNRRRRQTAYVTRGWHTWQGNFSNQNSTIDKSDIFSAENKQFIATYLKPQQKAILTAQLPKNENQTIVIDFDLWEATRNMKLKFCCDTLKRCVFETETGLKRGNRRWLSRQARCPAGTKRVIFECINHGNYQGACGLDNIKLTDEKCPSGQTAKVYLLDGGEHPQ